MSCRSGWRTTSGWASKLPADLWIEFVSVAFSLGLTDCGGLIPEAIRARLKPCPNQNQLLLRPGNLSKTSESQVR